MKIKNIELPDQFLALAPMEDVTDPSFRFICKQYGADIVYTEFISVEGLIRDGARSLKKLTVFDRERPVGIQIYGHRTDNMLEGLRMAEEAGPDLIDLNFGCPVRKIAERGAGAGLLKDIPAMVKMTGTLAGATRLPLTVKTRLGWNKPGKEIIDVALRLQDAGIAALAIHGRTAKQMSNGEADWTLIGEIKNHPSMEIPVIGNGDVDGPVKAAELFEKYGVDGIMIGRAAVGRPWIFRQIRHYLGTGEIMPGPGIDERVDLAREHVKRSIEWKGDIRGINEMRRHLNNYFKGLPGFREIRLKLLTSMDAGEINDLLDMIREKYVAVPAEAFMH